MMVPSAIASSPIAEPSRATAAFRATARLEVVLQRREPLTWLAAIVFTALTAGFTGSDAVALVPPALRGDAAATAPMVLALAISGLTAFGQVITTMLSATAFLRASAVRVDPLLQASPAPWWSVVAGQWSAVVVVLGVVTLAMPLGAGLGAALRGDAWWTTLAHALRSWLWLVLPATLLTASVQTLAAVTTRSLYGVLGTALALLALWQATTSPTVVATLGAWVTWADPFGSAPLLAAVRAADAPIGTLEPWTSALAMQRSVVAGLGLVVAAVAIRLAPRGPALRALRRVAADGLPARPTPRNAAAAPAPVAPVPAPSPLALVPPVSSAIGVARAQARLLVRTTLRERGFFVIALLGTANVVANIVAAGASERTSAGGLAWLDVLPLAQQHGRLFLILLATIYAGELLWRDRDVRVAGLVDTTPAATTALVLGRVAGLLLVEGLVVSVLLVAALGTAWLVGARGALDGGALIAWFVAVGVLPFVQLTLVSLLVQVVVGHKVIAHLALITSWVVAVTLDQQGFDRAWYRLADVPAGAWTPEGGATAALWWGATHWSVVALWALCVACAWWPRGATGAPRGRRPLVLQVMMVVLPIVALWTGWQLDQRTRGGPPNAHTPPLPNRSSGV